MIHAHANRACHVPARALPRRGAIEFAHPVRKRLSAVVVQDAANEVGRGGGDRGLQSMGTSPTLAPSTSLGLMSAVGP